MKKPINLKLFTRTTRVYQAPSSDATRAREPSLRVQVQAQAQVPVRDHSPTYPAWRGHRDAHDALAARRLTREAQSAPAAGQVATAAGTTSRTEHYAAPRSIACLAYNKQQDGPNRSPLCWPCKEGRPLFLFFHHRQ
jgi:spore germination cell wall hydrolase CwlJ-like protein